jgi:CAAX protease family protein
MVRGTFDSLRVIFASWAPAVSHVPQLLLAHTEVVPYFVNDRLPNLVPNFILRGRDGFNILLIEHHVIWPGRQIEDALLGRGHTMKESQAKCPWPSPSWRLLTRRKILDQHGNVLDPLPEFQRKRIECLFYQFREPFAFHLRTSLGQPAARPTTIVNSPSAQRSALESRMDNQAQNSSQLGPQLVPPLPAPKRPLVARIFLDQRGLRAGWRLVLYLIAVILLLGLSTHILRAVFGLRPGIQTPAMAIALESAMFLSAAIPAFIASFLEKRPWGAYGLPLRAGAAKHFLTGLAVGFAALSALLLMIHLSHGFTLGAIQLHGRALAYYAVSWGIAFLLVGFFEEFFFRGYSLFTLATGSKFWVAGIILSVIFGAVHLNNGGEDWLGALNAGLVGLIFVFSLWRTGSLWFAVGAHASWDWAESFFYGVPDSGNKSIGALFNPHFAGSKWITGGSVGPEGSLYAFAALAFIALCVQLLYPRRHWQVP